MSSFAKFLGIFLLAAMAWGIVREAPAGWREGFAVAFLAVTAIPIARGDRPDASGMYELLPILVFTGITAVWGGAGVAMFMAPLWASWIRRFPPATPTREGVRQLTHVAALVLGRCALLWFGMMTPNLLWPGEPGASSLRQLLWRVYAATAGVVVVAGLVAWATRPKAA